MGTKRVLNKPMLAAQGLPMGLGKSLARNANMIQHGYAGIGDIARATRISKPTLMRWLDTGKIDGCRLGGYVYVHLLSMTDLFAEEENFVQYFAIQKLQETLLQGKEPLAVPRLPKALRVSRPKKS
jgi:hypothetical protein